MPAGIAAETFALARARAVSLERARGGIGTLGEKTLHAVLKYYYEADEARHEVKIGPFVADIVGEDGIVEIQTRSFERLRKKLEAWLEVCAVTVVYPIPNQKWLLWIDGETGEITKKRKSPKRGGIHDALPELYKIRQLLSHPNFALCIALVDLEEYRRLDGWSRDKKRGSTRCERIPVGLAGEHLFRCPGDYLAFVPGSLAERFTTRDLARAVKIPLRTAQTGLNILHHLGAVRRVGKQGNLYVYERAPQIL